MQTTMLQLKGLTVAHAVLLLSMDVFPQPPEASARGPLQLLDALQERGGKRMPAGFLDDLAQHCIDNGDTDMLDGIVGPVGMLIVFLHIRERMNCCLTAQELASRASRMSVAGEWQPELSVLARLASNKTIAAVCCGLLLDVAHCVLKTHLHSSQSLVRLPTFLPSPLPNGRLFQSQSFLAPFFALTAVPDPITVSFTQPNVMATYFHAAETRNPQELRNGMASLRVFGKQLYEALHALTDKLLRNKVWSLDEV